VAGRRTDGLTDTALCRSSLQNGEWRKRGNKFTPRVKMRVYRQNVQKAAAN